MKTKSIASGLIARGMAFVAGSAMLSAGPEFRWEEGETSLALLNGERVVWRHVHDVVGSKPYFHPLATVDGTVLTELSPDDHPWHRAGWFSWKSINGVNYWEEDAETGQSEGLTEICEMKVEAREDFSAEIALGISYRERGKTVVLDEKRTLRIGAPDEDGNYAIDWTAVFAARDDVTLGRIPPLGRKGGQSFGGYAGLSVRASGHLRHWTFRDSEGRVNDSHGKAARWVEFRGALDEGREAGICLFDDPGNPGYPNKWYVNRGMPYLGPALLFDEGMALKKGEKLSLSYRILVQSQAVDLAAWAPVAFQARAGLPTWETIRKYEDRSVEMYGPYAPVKLPLANGVPLWNPTAIEQGPGGMLYVANYTGEICSLHDTDGDGLEDTTKLFCNVTENGLRYPTCMVWKGEDLYVGTTQEIRIYTDTDGDGRADRSRVFFDDFPWTLHVFDWTFGLTFGPDGHLYAIFCTDYLNGKPAPDPKGYRGAIVRIAPDGKRAERFATGLRFAYGLAFNDQGDLFFSDNKGGGNPTEELNHAVRGSFHGHDPNQKYPDHPEATPTLVEVKNGFGPGGLVFNARTNDFGGAAGQMFLACWGPDGKFDRGSITRFELEKEAHGTYRAREFPVAMSCAKVIDLAFGPDGDLYAAQFGREERAHRPYKEPEGGVYRFIPAPWVQPKKLVPPPLVAGDAIRGRRIYVERACATCHESAEGKETLGPPLCDAGEMFDREEMLIAIRDPGRGIKSGYETQKIACKDGTVLLGRVVSSSEKSLELVIPGNVAMVISREMIASVEVEETSAMPAGLLEGLSESELNDLLAYLRVREVRQIEDPNGKRSGE